MIEIHLGYILGLSCVISGSSWGFCLAMYDFVGLILGHFGPMSGPTTYLLGLYWATSGLCSALQHIGSVGGLYVGLILAQVAILGHFKAMLGLSGVLCRRIRPLGGLC